MKAILCRIAWMNKYDGKDEDNSYDPGGMNWEGKEKYCGEFWNFVPGPDGQIRGYVMIQAKDRLGNYTGTIDITKLGAKPQDNFIDGVKVIFYAKNPEDGKNYVIGWYENAKVLRNWTRGDSFNDYRKDPQNNNEYYSFLTTIENAFLIEPEERNIEIPKASANNTGYPGQSNVFYGISNPEFVRSVISKLEAFKNNYNDKIVEPEEEYFASEGRKLLRIHIQKERSGKLIKMFKATLKNYSCIICGFNFEEEYGIIGKNYIEAHHTIPVMSLDDNATVNIKDLIPVCSNCHRMLHRRIPPYTVDEMKKFISKQDNKI